METWRRLFGIPPFGIPQFGIPGVCFGIPKVLFGTPQFGIPSFGIPGVYHHTYDTVCFSAKCTHVCSGCTISEIHPKFQILFFLIETVEKAQKLTFTVLNRTNCSWNKIGRWIEISGSQNPEMLPCARKLNIYSGEEGCVSGQLGRLKGCACLCWPKIWLRIKWWRSRRTEGHPNNKFTDLKCLRCSKFGKFHLSKGVID